jgi:hypothetical protein
MVAPAVKPRRQTIPEPFDLLVDTLLATFFWGCPRTLVFFNIHQGGSTMNTNRKIFSISRISALLGFFVLAQAVACDGDQDAQKAADQESGQAMLSVGTIPDNVACVIVTIAGEFRTEVRDFAVTPGSALSEALTGLPVGTVVFSANAYSQGCGSVTKSTVPMWLSEEKTVNLVQGKSSSVTLTLYKNGRAKVTVEFADQEDGGTDAGATHDGGGSVD